MESSITSEHGTFTRAKKHKKPVNFPAAIEVGNLDFQELSPTPISHQMSPIRKLRHRQIRLIRCLGRDSLQESLQESSQP
jgi:hypothetical protein